MHVKVYVVFPPGVTERVPLVETAPIPLSIEADVEFVQVNVKVDAFPWMTEFGEAEIDAVGDVDMTVYVISYVAEDP